MTTKTLEAGTAPAPHPVRSAVLALAFTALESLLLAWALGGVAALLAHPRAPALVATWAVGAVVLAAFRPVRRRDVPVADREPPHVLIALFLLPLLTAPVAAFGESGGIWPLPGGATRSWIGVAIAALGLALRIAAMAQLGARFSPRVALQHGHALETRGLYGRIRHPGYVGAWVASLGGALAFDSALALPLVAAMGALLHARAAREEAMLEGAFGDEYRRYRARTGRFLPRRAR